MYAEVTVHDGVMTTSCKNEVLVDSEMFWLLPHWSDSVESGFLSQYFQNFHFGFLCSIENHIQTNINNSIFNSVQSVRNCSNL